MAAPAPTSAARAAEVWERLARVTDPELDEPVTGLGFVHGVEVGPDGVVAIGFRLPTYWCAANFAFMMADDMRREVASLSWVRGIRLTLDDHMYADAVNRGMAEGLSFRAAFGPEADSGVSDDELAEVRRTFAIKSFQRRQEALLRHLLGAGHQPEALLSLTVAGLAALPGADTLVTRYLERRDVAGPVSPEAAAFVDETGSPIPAAALAARLRVLRRVGLNTEFNGALCRGLLAERYGDAAPCGGEPTLLDFIRRPPGDRAVRA